MKILISLLTILLGMNAHAFKVSPVLEKKMRDLSEHREWRRLIHYHKFPFGWGWTKSRADGHPFFLSGDGKTDPFEEMKATVEAFDQDVKIGHLKAHPQCAFPARYQWLKQNLKLDIEDVPCPEFSWWIDQLSGIRSLSLVFASYFAGNPASFFGHSFIKLNARKNEGGRELLDYAINFSARTDTDHGVEFAMRGLFGGYAGQYDLKPYYVKINEYHHNESRDLWEYELNIPETRIRFMLAHLWELTNTTYFDYYFLDDNCSFQLLTLLEVAMPEWDLSHGFYLYALPSDTIKRVYETEGAVINSNYRPSFKKKMLARYERQSKSEKEQMGKVLDGKGGPLYELSTTSLEALIAFLRFKRFEDHNLSDEETQLLQNALKTRANRDENSPELLQKEIADREWESPHLSHETASLAVHVGNDKNSEMFWRVVLRPALQDFFNRDQGLPPYSQTEVFKMTFGKNKARNRFLFEEFTPFATTSLNPMTALEKKPSWGLRLTNYADRFSNCSDCRVSAFEASGGLNWLSSKQTMSYFFMALLEPRVGRSLNKGWGIGLGARTGLIWRTGEDWKLGFESRLINDFSLKPQEQLRTRHEVNVSWHPSQIYEVRLQYNEEQDSRETSENIRNIESQISWFF